MKSPRERKVIPAHTLQVIELVVDYDLTDEQAVTLGNYDRWSSPPYRAYYQDPHGTRRGKQKVEAVLVRFDAQLQRYDVGLAFKKWLKLKGAGVRELLALGAQFPDLQRQFTVVSLSPDKKPVGDPWTSPLLEAREIDGEMRRVFRIPICEIWWDHPVCFLALRD
ncbi:MAG: hypothetical protein G01um101420_653 [Parcubacteria group bacterium Gr01-1014_20]|nr:MAG: hypothetical protein G01um101420_653 [Parcubacteria group bacterium Gr01-1014_20]